MPELKKPGFMIATAGRLALLVGIRHVRQCWNGHTVSESFEGNATPLEAAAFLTLQNIPRLKKRRHIDRKLRKFIQRGVIRRGVLANGYPEPEPQQVALFSNEETEPGTHQPGTADTKELASLIEEVTAEEQQILAHEAGILLDDDDYYDEEYETGPRFLYGFLTGTALVALIPLVMWGRSEFQTMPIMQQDHYSPNVIKVAAASGQDCTRAKDLYSQLYCGELWRKELTTRVEQTYADLLAVSTAIDDMQRKAGLAVDKPLADSVTRAHTHWLAHMETTCTTSAAVINLGTHRGNQYLDCVHKQLLTRESDIRGQLNYLRGLGWHKEASEVLNNELIAIRNLHAVNPAPGPVKDTAEDKEADSSEILAAETDEAVSETSDTESQAQPSENVRELP